MPDTDTRNKIVAAAAVLVICVAFLSLGLVTDYAFGRHAESSIVAASLYHVVPNLGPFWVIDGLYAESTETAVPLEYVGYATSYAGLLTISILALAIFAFQKREVG